MTDIYVLFYFSSFLKGRFNNYSELKEFTMHKNPILKVRVYNLLIGLRITVSETRFWFGPLRAIDTKIRTTYNIINIPRT